MANFDWHGKKFGNARFESLETIAGMMAQGLAGKTVVKITTWHVAYSERGTYTSLTDFATGHDNTMGNYQVKAYVAERKTPIDLGVVTLNMFGK